MANTWKHRKISYTCREIIPGPGNSVISSFQEFLPFCCKLYFISNYKNFNS